MKTYIVTRKRIEATRTSVVASSREEAIDFVKQGHGVKLNTTGKTVYTAASWNARRPR